MRLKGKTAIVTGAGTGIGRATVLRFAAEGAHVVAGVYQPQEAAQFRDPAIATVVCDVTQESSARELVRTALERFSALDILVNNAGVVVMANVEETTDEDWNRVFDVNLRGLFYCCKHSVGEMSRRGGGAIVNVSSINGLRGNHRLFAYSASKGGVVAATMSLALDYAPYNIRVNCVCPATIADTPMVAQSLAQAPDPEQYRQYLLEKHPLGRLGRAEEVAHAILFLASDEASFITGVALPVDGGRSIR
ncbi:MAG: SDR family oxidoreductase [Bryobacteraceae bacterium]|nr:SDR family oxidoreductase [Bryobacteraceae bacterium]MDW8378135.1 SDR family NAD(P)-dependent oxidoreductase [Bryobacterales bacterium]